MDIKTTKKIDIGIITNICDHYSVRLYEALAQCFEVMFYFTGGGDHYRKAKARRVIGEFPYKNFSGFFIMPRVRIIPGIFSLLWSKHNIFIKSMDDRFALPLVFCIAKLRRKPFILWTDIWQHPSTFFHRISFGVTKIIYAGADAIVVQGGRHVTQQLLSFGLNGQKIFCGPHAVDNDLFNGAVGDERKALLRRQLDAVGKKIVLFIGRFEECKGLEYLIEALRLVKREDVLLLMIGSGPREDAYHKKCTEEGVQAKFIGYILNTHLVEYYAIAEVFVLPSVTMKDFKEPWGLVVNEAMNQGCPVVVSDAVGAGMGGLVKDGINGFIVPERNAQSLAKALLMVLTNGVLREQMSINARAEVQQWTHAKMVDAFAAAVDYALKQRKG